MRIDAELRGFLQPHPGETCADTFLRTFADRYQADLEGIRGDPPPFVDEHRLAWMHDEVDSLIETVRRSPAFAVAATSPIHGDVWANNILITRTGDWYLLDWDDLTLGDSALDVAMLLASASPTLDARDGFARLTRAQAQKESRQRLELYARAIVLDWTIDPLSDWMDAVTAPDHLDRVRDEKQRIHQQSYAWYRARYG
jgi:thiamine kinase-like enzyme